VQDKQDGGRAKAEAARGRRLKGKLRSFAVTNRDRGGLGTVPVGGAGIMGEGALGRVQAQFDLFSRVRTAERYSSLPILAPVRM
jgi:hypothetical protein